MKQYFALGSYTESILFGTGEVFKGKGKGIRIGTFEDGKIEFIKELEIRNPSFLCINEDNKKIYVVNEMKKYKNKTGGGVSQISYDEDFNMVLEDSWNTGGTDPCHIAIEPKKNFVAVSNFASGSITTYPVDEAGNIKGEGQLFQHKGSSIHPIRQKGPHAHSCIFAPDMNMMYVPDLGVDGIIAYSYKNSLLEHEENRSISVSAGSGPRYGEFSKDGKYFYLINEIASQVACFFYKNGNMNLGGIVKTLPDDFTGENICSDLHITPNGRFLYASNRGHDSIVCYNIENDGSLTFVERQPCGGKTPRNFAIDPSGKYLLVGNQDSDTIVIFTINENGAINQVDEVETGSPVCIKFFESCST